jgi:predicted nucleic acid-binding protein
MCRPVSFTEDVAEEVGRLLRISGTSDVVDAAVVFTAIQNNCAVLTSDPHDLRRIADAAGTKVRLFTV